MVRVEYRPKSQVAPRREQPKQKEDTAMSTLIGIPIRSVPFLLFGKMSFKKVEIRTIDPTVKVVRCFWVSWDSLK
jgi:hypothetical protein